MKYTLFAIICRMPLLRPKVFFDTCIYLDAAKQSGGISADDWRFVDCYVRNHYEILVSWTTLKELLCRLENCGANYFVRNQNALKLASRHGRVPGRFLDKAQLFAIQYTLGVDPSPRLDPSGLPNLSPQKWAEGVLDAVFMASSKDELLNVYLAPKKMCFSFDLRDFAAHEEKPRSEFVWLCNGWRTGEVEEPHPFRVALGLLHDAGLKPSGADAHKLSRALDAVNSTVNWFWSMSRNPGYDFEKHKNNWDDIQQLYYLCDPTMTFVTLNTRDFMQWTKNSPQASQVVSWKEFCKNARAASQRPVKDGL